MSGIRRTSEHDRTRPRRESTSVDWRDFAACRDVDPELFFPVGNTPAADRQRDRAKAVCRGCFVVRPCLDDALDTKVDGVWGGTSEYDRTILKRRRARQRRNERTTG